MYVITVIFLLIIVRAAEELALEMTQKNSVEEPIESHKTVHKESSTSLPRDATTSENMGRHEGLCCVCKKIPSITDHCTRCNAFLHQWCGADKDDEEGPAICPKWFVDSTFF